MDGICLSPLILAFHSAATRCSHETSNENGPFIFIKYYNFDAMIEKTDSSYSTNSTAMDNVLTLTWSVKSYSWCFKLLDMIPNTIFARRKLYKNVLYAQPIFRLCGQLDQLFTYNIP